MTHDRDKVALTPPQIDRDALVEEFREVREFIRHECPHAPTLKRLDAVIAHLSAVPVEGEEEWGWVGEADGEEWVAEGTFGTRAEAEAFEIGRNWIRRDGGTLCHRRKAGEWEVAP